MVKSVVESVAGNVASKKSTSKETIVFHCFLLFSEICDADAAMLLRRLKVYRYIARVRQASARCKFCAKCSAQLSMAQADVQI